MQRREFLGALAGAMAGAPFAARAQSTQVVGFISSGAAGDQLNLYRATLQGLKDAGFAVGQNVKIEPRFAEGKYDRLSALAQELVNRNVSVIIAAGGSDPGRAAKALTLSMPIVFITAADPVRTGLVNSLNRPEANVTGIAMVGATLEAKRIELLHELVPQASAVGVLINPGYPAARAQRQEAEEATQRLGLKLVLAEASKESDFDLAFATFVDQNAGALLLANDPFFGSSREKLAALAIKYSLPAISFRREFLSAGGLLSYGSNFEIGYRQAGVYAGRILAGAKPAELPVMQPTKFELVVNLKTAKTIGLAVSEVIPATRRRGDRIGQLTSPAVTFGTCRPPERRPITAEMWCLPCSPISFPFFAQLRARFALTICSNENSMPP